jgi:hypothetical protein
VHLVDRGARLRDVAGVMNIPMALRHIKPGVAHFAHEVFCQHPDLLVFIPATTPRQHIWLPLVCWACTIGDADFGAWAARHVLEIPGCTLRVVGSFLSDIADWACRKTGREFITRPFTPSMSLKTTIELSADWHEAVANNLAEGPNATFPAPWYPPARLGDYEMRCPPGPARAPAKYAAVANAAAEWLKQHRADQPTKNAKAERKRLRRARAQRERMARQNAAVHTRIGKGKSR